MNKSQKRVVMVITATVLVLALVVGVALKRFLGNREPIKINYFDETRELTISPGTFYTLDGHEEGSIYVYDTVLRHVADSASEYRFRVMEHQGCQNLTIYYHDFTGQENYIRLVVNYSDHILYIEEEKPDSHAHSWRFFCVPV